MLLCRQEETDAELAQRRLYLRLRVRLLLDAPPSRVPLELEYRPTSSLDSLKERISPCARRRSRGLQALQISALLAAKRPPGSSDDIQYPDILNILQNRAKKLGY